MYALYESVCMSKPGGEGGKDDGEGRKGCMLLMVSTGLPKGLRAE